MIQRDDSRFEKVRIALEDELEFHLDLLSQAGVGDEDALEETYLLARSRLLTRDVDLWRKKVNENGCLPATHAFSLIEFLELFGSINAQRRNLGEILQRIVA